MIDGRDLDVLNVVLDDLLTYAGKDSPIYRSDPPKEILLVPTSARYHRQNVRVLLHEIQEDPGIQLTALQRFALKEALEDLVGKVADGATFDKLKLTDRRIRIYEEYTSSNRPAQSPGGFSRPITAWPPGYDEDKKFALVRLVIPWGRHHAEGIYLLSENQGKWTECLRHFVYYP
jgi:hypothetical protein